MLKRLLGVVALATSALSCGGSSGPSVVVLDRVDGDYFARPFPRDDRMKPDGTIDLTGLPAQVGLVKTWMDALGAQKDGFGRGTGLFFRFSAGIDPASLPATPAASTAPGASVFVVDLARDQRAPLLVNFSPYETSVSGPNILGLMPVPGLPLAPATRYAAIVTRQVKDGAGDAVGPDDGVSARLRDDPLFAPLREWVTRTGALGLDDIAGASVFTTSDPGATMAALREAALRDQPSPAPTVTGHTAEAAYDRYDGNYQTPLYLSGTPPYTRTGGTIVWDAGKPVLQGMETVRFTLGVPRSAPPANGYPAVIFAHGSGGDRMQAFTAALGGGALAPDMTGAGLVVFGMDLTLHGDRMRDGVDGGTATTNFENLEGSRDMTRQSSIDELVALRLLAGWPTTLTLPGTNQSLKIDPTRLVFMGFSRGALTGAAAMAREPGIRAAILVGLGAHTIEGALGLTYPINAKLFFELALNEEVELFSPMLTLLATVVDPADAANHLPELFASPPAGLPSRSLLVQMGVDDVTVGPAAGRASIRAAHVPLLGTIHDPIPHADLLGLAPLPLAPVTGNGPGGMSTGVAVQYKAPDYDAHFVIIKHAEARRHWRDFAVAAVASATGAPTFTP